MIQVAVGDELVVISDALLGEAFMRCLPGFLTGERQPDGMQQAAIKSGVKGLMPLLLGMLHKEIVTKHLPLMPPDLKCAAAKANIVTYTLAYLLSNAAILGQQHVFIAEGERNAEGILIISGITPTATYAGELPRGGDAPLALASGDAAHKRDQRVAARSLADSRHDGDRQDHVQQGTPASAIGRIS